MKFIQPFPDDRHHSAQEALDCLPTLRTNMVPAMARPSGAVARQAPANYSPPVTPASGQQTAGVPNTTTGYTAPAPKKSSGMTGMVVAGIAAAVLILGIVVYLVAGQSAGSGEGSGTPLTASPAAEANDGTSKKPSKSAPKSFEQVQKDKALKPTQPIYRPFDVAKLMRSSSKIVTIQGNLAGPITTSRNGRTIYVTFKDGEAGVTLAFRLNEFRPKNQNELKDAIEPFIGKDVLVTGIIDSSATRTFLNVKSLDNLTLK